MALRKLFSDRPHLFPRDTGGEKACLFPKRFSIGRIPGQRPEMLEIQTSFNPMRCKGKWGECDRRPLTTRSRQAIRIFRSPIRTRKTSAQDTDPNGFFFAKSSLFGPRSLETRSGFGYLLESFRLDPKVSIANRQLPA